MPSINPNTSITEQITTTIDVTTTSKDSIFSTYETTANVLPLSATPSYTYETSTQIADTASTQSSNMQ
ncbi:unnamed protein product, partial [Rotaria magnacalcarata]